MENQTFKITIFKNRLFSVRYAISQLRLNLRVIETNDIPGPLPSDEPDLIVTIKLLPGADLSEIFYLGDRARKEPAQIQTF
jgi:hypothetical protein